MQIDLRTVAIEPQRQAFDHLVRRFGNKAGLALPGRQLRHPGRREPPLQAHLGPGAGLYDETIHPHRMAGLVRAEGPAPVLLQHLHPGAGRQQETAEANFSFVETRGLVDMLPDELAGHCAGGAGAAAPRRVGREPAQRLHLRLRLRHRLHPALHVSRDGQPGHRPVPLALGLLLGDTDALDAGKRAWLDDAALAAPAPRYVEDCLVVRDPFELFVAQNHGPRRSAVSAGL